MPKQTTLPNPVTDHLAFCAAVFAALRGAGHDYGSPVYEAAESLLRARVSLKFGKPDEADERILRAITLLCEGGTK